MDGIKGMVRELVSTYHEISDDKKGMFATPKESLGKCPQCGEDVIKGRFGAYCSGKCGFSINKARGQSLTDAQIKAILEGKKILLKGLKSNSGKV